MSNEHVVEMRGISKTFGTVQALNDVDLELRRGELLGLVGDNAAGKSTLMKTLFGSVIPDAGEIFIEGEKAELRNPRDAQALGLAMIYQDLAVFNNLDVAANVFTGREYTRRILGITFLNRKRMEEESQALLDRLRINISSSKLLVERMSGGQRQMVAVARAIGFDARILIMDEPTAALGVKEANTLLDLMAGLRDQGISIILITHRISDVLAIGDRVMVLKGGERQGVLDVEDSTLEDIESLIVRGAAYLQ
ncbi:MAG: ATP-binding cassette domain-containing protein [Caldilineaceae bacterium]|nr:ATP-binding cassette domain-containing protein [Caldilineaceae bacterium]MCY4089809.1 ATP-binding cassette domain-containing protein [Caldilineaceae bacterium]MCY4115833.1 ATP-binding cassette domain-containing protein [Caldilineaceae bacterium]MDE0068934.1 ATP-binding cassette domain-containing protein [Caldilineaceae bacterium]MDE0182439.1 ATP-binding cassette domain-containing protein [Caldilineaceae bacterium]